MTDSKRVTDVDLDQMNSRAEMLAEGLSEFRADDDAMGTNQAAFIEAVTSDLQRLIVEVRRLCSQQSELSNRFLSERDRKPLRGRRYANTTYDDGYRMAMEDAARIVRTLRAEVSL